MSDERNVDRADEGAQKPAAQESRREPQPADMLGEVTWALNGASDIEPSHMARELYTGLQVLERSLSAEPMEAEANVVYQLERKAKLLWDVLSTVGAKR